MHFHKLIDKLSNSIDGVLGVVTVNPVQRFGPYDAVGSEDVCTSFK